MVMNKKNFNDISTNIGLVISNHGNKVLIEDQNRNEYLCYFKKNIGSIVTGDKVIWQRQKEDKTNIIVSVCERKSLLERPSKFSKDKKPIAANIDQIIIVISVLPEPIEHYIDRYLIAAEYQAIRPILVINKTDLINPSNIDYFMVLKERYKHIGYDVYEISALFPEKFKFSLESVFRDKVSILVGQSGVGKSQITQAITNNKNIKIGDISESNKKGKHTTTTTKLYHIFDKSVIIDSPGIREFGLWDLPVEAIKNGFIEFHNYSSRCKFRNCLHTKNSVGCAVQEATMNGKIDTIRLNNYLRIIEERTQN